MKKLHIVLACSLLAVGCQNHVQASWFGKGEPAKAPKEVDPAKENKNEKDTTAKKKAEQDKISQQENEAHNRMQETNTQRANQVDTASKTAQDVFGKNKSQGKAASNMVDGPAKDSAIEQTTKNVINDALAGKNLPDETINQIQEEAIKNSKTWSDTWNESSFKQWIDTIVESVTQFLNKISKPFSSTSGINFANNAPAVDQANLTQRSQKGNDAQQSIKLSEESTPINSATSDLYRNVEKTADVAVKSDQLASGSKGYADAASKTKTDLAAKNTWSYALFGQ